MGSHNEYTFKVLVLGDPAVGKTSFVQRYINGSFATTYSRTTDVDFALKQLRWEKDVIVRLQLWDLAGQERFWNMTRVYYRGAVGAFILYDVSRPSTFEAVTKWKNDLDHKMALPDGERIPTVLLGTKCDKRVDAGIPGEDQLDEFCSAKGFTARFNASAKDGFNVNNAASYLIGQILANERLYVPNECFTESLQLSYTAPPTTETKKSCCW